jgi:hypothetical protein
LLLGAQDDGGLQAAEAGIGWPDLNRALIPVEFDVSEHVTPELGEQFGIFAVQDQFADSARHGRQCSWASAQ